MNFVLSSHLAAHRLASPRHNSGGWWTVLLCSLLCALPLSARNKIADAMKSDKMEVFASKNAAWTSTPVGLMVDPAVPTAQPAMVVIAADGKETEETGYDGSAPLRVRFEARATDYGTRTPLYEWQFHREGSSTPFLVRYDANTGYEFTESGTFTVRLLVSFVENGDTVTYTQNDAFRIAISESKLEFPNAFTPNGDGINDVFKAKEGYKSIVRFRALIFNRWGRKVYEWSDPAGGWDGRIGSAEAPDGAYYLSVEARGADGRNYHIKKTINLLRRFDEQQSGGTH